MLYVIVGDGTGNQKEIEGSLKDLYAKAVEGEQEFWFAIQPGDTKTTKYIVAGLDANEVYYDSIGTKKVGPKANEQRPEDPEGLIEFMQEYESEGVEMLALFVDADDDVEEDAALMAQVEAAVGADFTVRLLNAQLTKISFAEEGDEEVEEEQTGTLADDGEEEEPVEEAAAFTEADLKKMTVPELTAMAKGQGLDVKTIGKGKGDLIAAILASQEEAEDVEEALEEALDAALEADEEPEAPAPAPKAAKAAAAATNGHAVASEDVVKAFLLALGKALIAAAK